LPLRRAYPVATTERIDQSISQFKRSGLVSSLRQQATELGSTHNR
jgi:hypothetical protein